MNNKTSKTEKAIIPGVYERGNNKYRIEIYLPDHKGVATRFRKTVSIEDDLPLKKRQKILTELKMDFEKHKINELAIGGEAPQNQTLSEFIDYWRQFHAVPNLQPKTIERYDDLSVRVKEHLGDVRLCDLTPSHFNEFYHTLQTKEKRKNLLFVAKPLLLETVKSENIRIPDLAVESGINVKTMGSILRGNPTSKGIEVSKALKMNFEKLFEVTGKGGDELSSATISHYSQYLKALLNKATEWEVISRNPVAHVKPPKQKSTLEKSVKHYDSETVKRLLEALEDAPIKYKTMIYIAIFSGCRIGELVALEWKHIDFEQNVIIIQQSAQRLKDKGVMIKGPKSMAGNRKVPTDKCVMELLQEYKEWQQNEMQKIDSMYDTEAYDSFVFTQADGSIIYPSTPAWWFRKFIKENGLPPLSFHGLRHTHATLLLEADTSVNVVSQRLGHSRISTTVDTYCHVSNDAAQAAVEKLNSLLR